MGILDSLLDGLKKSVGTSSGVIPYGKNKKDDSHDHRTNTGSDRTPSQKDGDKKKRKS